MIATSRRMVRGVASVLLATGLTGVGVAMSPAHALDACYSYTYSGTSATIVSGSGCSGVLVIPATFTDASTTYTVVAIGSNAFDSSGLTSVTIPNTVTSIGYQAFRNSTSITSVTFQPTSTLATIEEGAFALLHSLTSITLPTSVTSIGEAAFYDDSLLATVNIAALTSLTDIGPSAFEFSALTSVTFPASVTTIGWGAFSGCASLRTVRYATGNAITSVSDYLFQGDPITTLKLPSTIESIGASAFQGSNLSGIALPASLTTIHEYAFQFSPKLAFVDFPDGLVTIGPLAFQGTAVQSVTIPSSVTEIGLDAFYEVSALTDLALPDTGDLVIGDGAFKGTSIGGGGGGGILTVTPAVRSIGNGAFAHVTTMTSLVLPDADPATHPLVIGQNAFYDTGLVSVDFTRAVTEIGASAFRATPSLTSVTFPDEGSMTIGHDAFYETGLTSATIGASVTSIDYEAFFTLHTLTHVDIAPAGLTYIGNSAFLQTGIDGFRIPTTLTDMGNGVFTGCRNLTAFTLAGPNENFSIDDAGVLFNGDGSELISYPSGRAATSYRVPAVSSIRFEGLAGAGNLASVTFDPAATLTALPERAFEDSGLTSIAIPPTVSTIGERAFRETPMTTITIPATVTHFDKEAFDYARQLDSVRFLGNAPSFENDIFARTPLSTIYYNPATSGWDEAFAGVLAPYAHIRTSAPVYSGGVSVNGLARKGTTVSVATGTWGSDVPTTYFYKWYACKRPVRAERTSLPAKLKCRAIAGQLSSQLKVTRKLRGRYLVARVIASNEFGSVTRYSASSRRVR